MNEQGRYGEPWVFDDGRGRNPAIMREDGFNIANDMFGDEEGMKRAVACVKALSGLDPGAVRELVEAVEAMMKTLETHDMDSLSCNRDRTKYCNCYTEARSKCYAALSKLRGGK